MSSLYQTDPIDIDLLTSPQSHFVVRLTCLVHQVHLVSIAGNRNMTLITTLTESKLSAVAFRVSLREREEGRALVERVS